MKESCIVLAAGRGSRFGEGLKVMAGLHDGPILLHTARALTPLGLEKVMVVGSRGDEIIRYFEEEFVYQRQLTLNGNAGALLAGMERLDSHTRHILVVQVHCRSEAEATVLVTPTYNEKTHHRQCTIFDRRLVSINEEVKDVGQGGFFTGTACFKREFLLNYLPRLTPDRSGELIIPQLFKLALTDAQKICVVVTEEDEWWGINTPEELAVGQRLMSARRK
jgi:bifunctional N-acetylglucosamine-1-phosphate-uridyltransferase/glucosamine-1-phosphate-acetyltransferase GlmU-like protein